MTKETKVLVEKVIQDCLLQSQESDYLDGREFADAANTLHQILFKERLYYIYRTFGLAAFGLLIYLFVRLFV